MTVVKTETAQTPVVEKPTIPTKLTAEEKNQRYAFIGKCVDKGINFPGSNKFGVMGSLTMQDLCTSTTKTLQDIAKGIKVLNEKHDPEFDGKEPLRIAGVFAEDWLNFLRFTIRKKNHDTWAAARRAEIKALNTTIDQAKTPDELRREAEARLNELKALGLEED